MQLLFQTAGLLALLALYGLLRAVRLPSAAALFVTIIFMLNPTVILYEHLLYYTYIEGVLILLAAFCLLQWFCSRQTLWAVCLLAGAWLSRWYPVTVSPGLFCRSFRRFRAVYVFKMRAAQTGTGFLCGIAFGHSASGAAVR